MNDAPSTSAWNAVAADWPALNALLDEALSLPPAEREPWLQQLDATHAPLKATLGRLLAVQAGIESGNFLGTLPRWDAAAATPAAAPVAQPGEVVGPWRLQRELGAGGMGSVWLAERADGTLKRPVALKLPLLGWARGLSERMARERDILATLEHPNIARLYDAGVDALGRPWLALEYVQGRPIDIHCRDQALSPRQRVELLLQVCAAVAYAHSRLVIHRDLKPGNVLVTADGQVRLLDFGIAGLLQEGGSPASPLTLAAGRALTPDCASPEQIRGEALGTASDVYSLGVLAYGLLAGTRPYRLQRGSAAELEEAIATADPPPASTMATERGARQALRGNLDAILHKALRKRPADRYATVKELADDLQRHLAGETIVARPDTPVQRVLRFGRRHRGPLAAAAVVAAAFGLALGAGATALVILALLLGLGAALWQAQRARMQAETARRHAARAQAVQGFLLDIFRSNSDQQPDPQAARKLTARELLDRGAGRVETALANDAESRAEVLETLAEMYYQLGLDEQSAALEERRITLLRQLPGPADRRLAAALVKLTASLHATPRREEILPLLEEAEQILDRCGEGDTVLRAELLARLAQRHQNLSVPKMLACAQASLRVHRAQARQDPGELSTALHMVARALLLSGARVEANRYFAEAIEVLERMDPRPHVPLLQTRVAFGDALTQQDRVSEARACLQQACEEGRTALGAGDVNLIAASSRLANALHALGERGEARQLHRQALAKALELRGSDDPLFTTLARANFARDLYAEGALDEAWSLLEAVNMSNRRHYAGSVVLAGSLRMQALVAAACDDPGAAQRLLSEAWGHWQQASSGGLAAWRANRLHLCAARLALARRDAPSAMDALEKVLPPGVAATPLRAEEAERDLLRAQAQLALGHFTAGLAAAQAAMHEIDGTALAAQAPALRAEAQTTLARALLAAGAATPALAPAQQAAAWRTRHETPASPWAAQAREVAQACQAALAMSAP